MRFYKKDDTYIVTRITGPHHNYLGLRVAEGSGNESTIQLIDLEKGDRKTLNGDDIRSSVAQGIKDANILFGTSYFASTISYISSDTNNLDIYRKLAFSIVEGIFLGKEFIPISE